MMNKRDLSSIKNIHKIDNIYFRTSNKNMIISHAKTSNATISKKKWRLVASEIAIIALKSNFFSGSN
jgi:hypothetical protein